MTWVFLAQGDYVEDAPFHQWMVDFLQAAEQQNKLCAEWDVGRSREEVVTEWTGR